MIIKLHGTQQSRIPQKRFSPAVRLYFNFVPPHFAPELASSSSPRTDGFTAPGETADARLLLSVRHIPRVRQQHHPNPPPPPSVCTPLPTNTATTDQQTERTLRGLQARAQSRLGGVGDPAHTPPQQTEERRAARRTKEEGAGRLLRRQGFPTGETPPRPVEHWERKTSGSCLPRARFKSGLYVMAARFQAKEEVSAGRFVHEFDAALR